VAPRDIARPQIEFRFGWKSGHATVIHTPAGAFPISNPQTGENCGVCSELAAGPILAGRTRRWGAPGQRATSVGGFPCELVQPSEFWGMLTASGQSPWELRDWPWELLAKQPRLGAFPLGHRIGCPTPINSAIRGCHTVTEGWVLYSPLAASPVWLPRLAGWPWEPLAAHPRLSRGLSHGARSIVRLFLSGELLLGMQGCDG
jgi:hypothetical protein